MLLEIREVSRKTPRDGRLELTEGSARRLGLLPAPLMLAIGDQVAAAELDALECTCGKATAAADGDPHRHHFLRSPLLMQLTVGESVVVELDTEGRVQVARPHPRHPA